MIWFLVSEFDGNNSSKKNRRRTSSRNSSRAGKASSVRDNSLPDKTKKSIEELKTLIDENYFTKNPSKNASSTNMFDMKHSDSELRMRKASSRDALPSDKSLTFKVVSSIFCFSCLSIRLEIKTED